MDIIDFVLKLGFLIGGSLGLALGRALGIESTGLLLACAAVSALLLPWPAWWATGAPRSGRVTPLYIIVFAVALAALTLALVALAALAERSGWAVPVASALYAGIVLVALAAVGLIERSARAEVTQARAREASQVEAVQARIAAGDLSSALELCEAALGCDPVPDRMQCARPEFRELFLLRAKVLVRVRPQAAVKALKQLREVVDEDAARLADAARTAEEAGHPGAALVLWGSSNVAGGDARAVSELRRLASAHGAKLDWPIRAVALRWIASLVANPSRAAGVARADLAELAQALGDADLAGWLRVP